MISISVLLSVERMVMKIVTSITHTASNANKSIDRGYYSLVLDASRQTTRQLSPK